MIYPQQIRGKYRSIKNYVSLLLLAIYFLGSWITWQRIGSAPSQAILMDLPHRRAYFFGIEIWADELYYITGILILAAMGLFFFTSLFGRLWCGYTCPHTVIVDLFRYVEYFFQGNRNDQIKLDESSFNAEKFYKKAMTHIAWLIIAFAIAYGWVCYFYGAHALTRDLFAFQVTGAACNWLLGLTFTTYLFAGYIREKMCTHMCPYGRFQSAMLDNNTYVVTYHDWRGEPRGPLNQASGDCIDCGKCVVVCPMGIDIRDGLQMSCIGCGLCIDACNSVMSKIERPLGLINYDSIETTEGKKNNIHKAMALKLFKTKTIMFGLLFCVVGGLILYSLLNKSQLGFFVEKERAPLFVVIPDGSVRNSYIFKIRSKTHTALELSLKINGLQHYELMVQGISDYVSNFSFTLNDAEEKVYRVFLKVPAADVPLYKKQTKIDFILNLGNNVLASDRNMFYTGTFKE